MAEIHWFPGHMKKALNELENRLKYVDIVIVILDSRAPLSSLNMDLEKITKNKKKLCLLSKSDLADPNITPILIEELKKFFDNVIAINVTNKKYKTIIENEISKLGREKHAKEISRGMKPQPLKVAIIGVPNVGKSSLINMLVGKRATSVANKPGLTRGEQWVKVNNDFLLLDTPGILPMNYDDRHKAINVALIGSIKETILPNTDLVEYLLPFLKEHYPEILKERFGIESISSYEEVIRQIAQKRMLYKANNEVDILRAESVLLKEIKDGLIGKISFDRI